MPDNTLPPGMELALTSLKKADQDLVAVGKWLHDLDISDEIIGFHIQQCIEKSLKAILLHRAIDYPHTHNLRLLIDLCQNNGISVPPKFLEVDVFNHFAVQWRYDLLPSPYQSPLDRDAAYNLADQVWKWADKMVKKALPQ